MPAMPPPMRRKSASFIRRLLADEGGRASWRRGGRAVIGTPPRRGTRVMEERLSPPDAARSASHCSLGDYEALYRRSLEDPDGFWREQAKRIDWVKAPERIANW